MSIHKIIPITLVSFTIYSPFLFCETLKFPQLFIGLKTGYQWADDEAYKRNDPNDMMLGGFAGLRLSQAWSWDIGYQHHNKLQAKSTDIDVETNLFDSGLRYDWYLNTNNNLSVYGRIGVTYWDMIKKIDTSHIIKATGFSPVGEVGLNLYLNQNLRLSIGYQYVNGIGSSNTGQYDSHGLLLGLSYSLYPPSNQ
ncbi:MAG: outer membrane beta-barrel protein [Vibrio sp.]|uniref:outer membrane beta-barrel protein n=1 Tax=Vibrio sp. TaxID=678 RepID=UPI003A846876